MTRGPAPEISKIAIEEGDDRRSIVTPHLRLTFRWTGDRWAHSLEWPGGVVIRSVESDPGRERDEPARVVNPAFQQIGFQRAGASVQALLVGQAGTHHFSAAFTVEETPVATVIEVDLADRCREPVEALASTYTVGLTSSDLRDADSSRIIWERAGTRLVLASGSPPALLGLAEAGRGATRVQASAPGRPESATRRWAYRWVREPHATVAP